MKDKIGDLQRLLHIKEAITEIENYTKNISWNDFEVNSMMRFACIKQIEIIGEAANHISEETKAKFSNIEWSQIVGMRHILVHEYFGIDVQLIWQIILKDIPALKEAVQLIVSNNVED